MADPFQLVFIVFPIPAMCSMMSFDVDHSWRKKRRKEKKKHCRKNERKTKGNKKKKRRTLNARTYVCIRLIAV